MALALGRELADPGITKVVLDRLAGLPAERRAAALGKIGDAGVIPLLLEAGAAADPAVASAARESLAALSGEGVDAALVAQVETAEGVARRIATEAAGRRRIGAAVPAFFALADAPNPELRRAALAALGNTVSIEQLPALVERLLKVPTLMERLLKAGTGEERDATVAAVRAACTRFADKESTANVLIGALGRAEPRARQSVFEALAALGGPRALEALAGAALSDDAQLQDLATRVLGDWATPDAAETLRKVAEKAADARFRVRALRGYLRIARQMDISDHQRWAMGREALKIAERNEERALALEVFGRIRHARMLAVVTPYLQDAGLKEAAAAAVVSIAERLPPDEIKRAVEPLKQVITSTRDAGLVQRAKDALQKAEAAAGKR